MELNMSYWLEFIVSVVSKGHIQHYLQTCSNGNGGDGEIFDLI